MSRRKRTLIAIVVIELVLAGGWIWLHGMAMTSPHAARDSAVSLYRRGCGRFISYASACGCDLSVMLPQGCCRLPQLGL
jgi:hypothetical protein